VDCSAVPVDGELSTEEAVSVEDRLFSRDPSLQLCTKVIYTICKLLQTCNTTNEMLLTYLLSTQYLGQMLRVLTIKKAFRGLTSHSTLYRSFRGRFLQAR